MCGCFSNFFSADNMNQNPTKDEKGLGGEGGMNLLLCFIASAPVFLLHRNQTREEKKQQL